VEPNRIYLDYAASTPVDERVLKAMLPFFTEIYGNPSSTHFYGQQAEIALENSRQIVAQSLHSRIEEIVFTSCGTESDNLALRGVAFAQRRKKGSLRLLISPVEHHAVLHTAHDLERNYGFILEFLQVDEFGQVDPAEVESAIRTGTALVSVIYANNEIGTINPVAQIGSICRQKSVPFHTDAVQAAAHLPMNVERDQVDLMAIGAHKFYGPKGIGALYIRRGTDLDSTQTGGQQEAGLRAGTENIPYIVGLAEALRLAQQEVIERSSRLIPLRDRLIQGVLQMVPRARLTGHPSQRLPNHASFAFEGVDGNQLLILLDMAGFACSSGSACKVGTPQSSEILMAIGLSRAWSMGSLRVTLGKGTTPDQIDRFLQVLPGLVEKARTIPIRNTGELKYVR